MQTVTNRIWVLTLLPAWPFSQLKTDLLLSSGLGEELKRLRSKFLTQHRLIVICRLDPIPYDPIPYKIRKYVPKIERVPRLQGVYS